MEAVRARRGCPPLPGLVVPGSTGAPGPAGAGLAVRLHVGPCSGAGPRRIAGARPSASGRLATPLLSALPVSSAGLRVSNNIYKRSL